MSSLLQRNTSCHKWQPRSGGNSIRPSLQRGDKQSLTKTDPSLQRTVPGPGWDERGTDHVDFDLDASAFLLNAAVKVDLSKMAAGVDKAAITLAIHDAETRNRNFGQVSNAFARILNNAGDAENVRFDLSEDYSTETAMIFAGVCRHGDAQTLIMADDETTTDKTLHNLARALHAPGVMPKRIICAFLTDWPAGAAAAYDRIILSVETAPDGIDPVLAGALNPEVISLHV